MIDLLPWLRKDPGPPKGGYALRCAAEGCMRATKGGKPFCLKHVTMHPYAQEVIAGEREAARQRLAGRGPEVRADVTGFLMVKPLTTRQLERLVKGRVLPELAAMEAEGLITGSVRRSSRGKPLTHWSLRRPAP